MANHEKSWLVHGRPMTAKGVARRFGRSTTAVHQQLYYARRRVDEAQALEVVYDSYLMRERSGLLDGRRWAGKQHRVYGKMMTIQEAAATLGVESDTLRQWMYRHRDERGEPASLETAWYHYKQVISGRINQRPGLTPVKHQVDGRIMTVREAAAAAGCSMQALYCRMSRHKMSLEEAYHDADRLQRERAAREILRIMEGKL